MDVGLDIIGEVKVDDVRDMGNVDSACGDVGGDNNIESLGAKATEDPFTGTLVQVPVERIDRETSFRERIGGLGT